MVRDREAFNHRRKFFQLVKEEKRSGNFKGKLRFVVCPSPQQQFPFAPGIPLAPSHRPPYPRQPVAPTHNPPPTPPPLVQPTTQPLPSSQCLVTQQSQITRSPSPPPFLSVPQVNSTTLPPPSFLSPPFHYLNILQSPTRRKDDVL